MHLPDLLAAAAALLCRNERIKSWWLGRAGGGKKKKAFSSALLLTTADRLASSTRPTRHAALGPVRAALTTQHRTGAKAYYPLSVTQNE